MRTTPRVPIVLFAGTPSIVRTPRGMLVWHREQFMPRMSVADPHCIERDADTVWVVVVVVVTRLSPLSVPTKYPAKAAAIRMPTVPAEAQFMPRFVALEADKFSSFCPVKSDKVATVPKAIVYFVE